MHRKTIPIPYSKKPSMDNTNYQIHYNRDVSLTQLKAHSHDYYELYFFMSGFVTYSVENKRFHLKSGDIMLIQPGQEHYVEIAEKDVAYERYVLWLHPDYLKQFSTETTNLLLPFKHINFSGSYLSMANDMIVLVNNLLDNILIQSVSNEYGADLLAHSYILELLISIARAKLYHQPTYFSKDFDNNDLLANVLNYITDHICETITVQQIADATFVSRSFLSKKFTDSIKIPIHKYIIKKKLYLSKQELLNGSSIDSIYIKYNFGDYSSFYRAFKTEFGISPRNYKNFTTM